MSLIFRIAAPLLMLITSASLSPTHAADRSAMPSIEETALSSRPMPPMTPRRSRRSTRTMPRRFRRCGARQWARRHPQGLAGRHGRGRHQRDGADRRRGGERQSCVRDRRICSRRAGQGREGRPRQREIRCRLEANEGRLQLYRDIWNDTRRASFSESPLQAEVDDFVEGAFSAQSRKGASAARRRRRSCGRAPGSRPAHRACA